MIKFVIFGLNKCGLEASFYSYIYSLIKYTLDPLNPLKVSHSTYMSIKCI